MSQLQANLVKLASVALGLVCLVVAEVVLKGGNYGVLLAGVGGGLIGFPITSPAASEEP